eukprot:TRINITY_DN8801_c0_g1_i1.p1 TRINITY_DN8801_c0_g1~~TRINITY_DN8801_c0_g1_i1.p1  ORF type:complete len:462 (+),score=144.27 TRINITY_DN8801_c0_g1_i1:1085-2470(+)
MFGCEGLGNLGRGQIRNGFARLARRAASTVPDRVRGMQDLLPSDKHAYNHVVDAARSLCACYGFRDMSTPIVEKLSVFERTLGEGSDVFMKEMYTFDDLSGNRLAMRPENTAGVVRAFLNDSRATLPARYFYHGPMFRYERPQKGRTRQFHQLGVELLGSSSPASDVEVVEMAAAVLQRLRIPDVQLQINTLGDQESRTRYSKVLTDYFQSHAATLAPENQARLQRGSVLRILDSKAEADAPVIAAAPRLSEHLNAASAERFEAVLDGLRTLGIGYTLNPRPVPGLDSYSPTIFEFLSRKEDVLGPQQAPVLAGGRYDDLAKLMGAARDTPGMGWAAGLERLLLLPPEYEIPGATRPVAVITLFDEDPAKMRAVEEYAARLTQRLRRQRFLALNYATTDAAANNQLRRAARDNAYIAFMVNSAHLARGMVAVKHMDRGTQEDLLDDLIVDFLRQLPGECWE